MNDIVNNLTEQAVNYRPPDLSEAGAAEVFAKLYFHSMVWTKSLGWMVWNGRKWVQADAKATAQAMDFQKNMLEDAKKALADSVREDAEGEPSKDAKEYLRFARHMRGSKQITSVLTLAAALMYSEATLFDDDPFALNTPAGIIDLRTGKMHNHDPIAYCSKMTACSLSEEGRELWTSFLDTITGGDDELQLYLQISAGCCAIGQIFHEGLQIAIGGGRNGKSTYFNALAAVLGDYAGTIDVNVLTTERTNKGAAKATLRGKRLVTCGELEEGQRLSTQTLKQLASTDMLTIEEKYRAPETIRPTHHIVMFSNHLPRVGSTDDGTWRRIQLIPFRATIASDADIPNYAKTLVDKAGGAILSWIVEGAKMFCAAGHKINIPRSVSQATDDYRTQENWLQNFIADCCVVDTEQDRRGRWVSAGRLYESYKNYADFTGTYKRSIADFNRAMETAGYKKIGVHGNKKRWLNITTLEENDHFPADKQLGLGSG